MQKTCYHSFAENSRGFDALAASALDDLASARRKLELAADRADVRGRCQLDDSATALTVIYRAIADAIYAARLGGVA